MELQNICDGELVEIWGGDLVTQLQQTKFGKAMICMWHQKMYFVRIFPLVNISFKGSHNIQGDGDWAAVMLPYLYTYPESFYCTLYPPKSLSRVNRMHIYIMNEFKTSRWLVLINIQDKNNIETFLKMRFHFAANYPHALEIPNFCTQSSFCNV